MAKNIRIFIRSEKLQNESSPNFSNFQPEFCPEFCSEFSPNLLRGFHASFRAKRKPENFHQESPVFLSANFSGEQAKHHRILNSEWQHCIKIFLGNIFLPVTSCNLIWWAMLGGSKMGRNSRKCGETMGENKEIEKEETEDTRRTATILWLSLKGNFNYKTGHFSRFLPFWGPPSEVTAIFL